MMKNYFLTLLMLLGTITLVQAQDVITGGDMEDESAWSTSKLTTDDDNSVSYEFGYTTDTPAEGDGGCLYITGTNTGTDGGLTTNFMFYQQLTLQRGVTYSFDGAYKDVRTNNYWIEVYVGGNEPVDGTEYGGDQGAVLVSGFKSTNWETNCPSDAFDGTFASDACITGITNTVLFEGDGDTTVYFGFRMGIWDDQGSGYTFEAYVDNISLVPEGTTAVNAVQNNQVSVYPNPFNSQVNISSSIAIHEVEVINMLGQAVFSQSNLDSREYILNMKDQLTGIYFIKITDQNNNVSFIKSIKE